MTVIIAACTNRKRIRPATDLMAGTLPSAPLDELARIWTERLRSAEGLIPAGQLYAGRGPAIAARLSRELPAQLKFVSAGLGVVDAAEPVPAYDLTVAPSADGIGGRIASVGTLDPADWWALITARSPFGGTLRQTLQAAGDSLVLLALPGIYLGMLARELGSLSAKERARIRIFTGANGRFVPPQAAGLVMPYDARLDGPDSSIAGTRSDFPMRALAHFADTILSAGHANADSHAQAVRQALNGWRIPAMQARARYSDDELRALVSQHWEEARGQSGRMLRLFRDELGIACEQARMSRLVADVRNRRENEL